MVGRELDEDMIKEVQDRLELDPNFFVSLEKEDDWSFLVLAHAFFEKLTTEVLKAYLEKPGLFKFLPNLQMGGNTGKIELITSLLEAQPREDEKKFPVPEKKFLIKLGELRNQLVHDVTNYNFSFQAHVNLDAKDRFCNSFYVVKSEQPVDPQARMEKAKANPRSYLAAGAERVTFLLLTNIWFFEGMREFDRLLESARTVKMIDGEKHRLKDELELVKTFKSLIYSPPRWLKETDDALATIRKERIERMTQILIEQRQ